jgi:hypothetical protein
LSAAAADPFVAGFDTLLLAMGVNGAMGSIGLVRPPDETLTLVEFAA